VQPDTMLTHITSEKRVVYPPLWKCMYCEAVGVPLSTEHIIPAGLGGQLVLPRSSCEACRRTTRNFETTCLRTIMGNARVHFQYPTKNPERRPDKLKAKVRIKDRIATVEVAVKDHPAALHLIAFDEPRIMRADHIPRGQFIGHPWYYPINFNPERDLAKGITGLRVSFQPLVFSRMLAKIAHGYATAIVGLDAFTPLATELIRGLSDNAPYLVGGEMAAGTDPLPGVLYDLNLERRLEGENEYLVSRIRIFSHLGAPRYHVVVGKLGDGQCPQVPLIVY
jgi:hypothetical protein